MTANMQNVINALSQHNISFRKDESLAMHCTFKIGGNAAIFCEPAGTKELCEAIDIFADNGVSYYILGRGSNVLFHDEGYHGAVIHIVPCQNDACIKVNGNQLTANAGAQLGDVCRAARDAGLGGIEFAYGIPGSIGGAVYMNAGAYGGEIKDVLASVEYYDTILRKVCTVSASDAQMGYRTSVFANNPWCILNASFILSEKNIDDIDLAMNTNAKKRSDKQPLAMPSAGSAFKRPVGAFAGSLIDESGLRGYAVGGAAISTKHCGFIVNTGKATCKDVLQLASEVCDIVREKTGFVLEKEISVVDSGKME